MFYDKFFASLLLTFSLLVNTSYVLSEVPAQITSSRHQVSIRLSADDDATYGSGHICSGTLISNFTVLTAATCLLKPDAKTFYSPSELRVVMGNLNRNQKDPSTHTSQVIAVKTHGRFNRRTYANNLALLELDSVEFGPTIIPVLTSNEKVFEGLNCYVLGWRNGDGELTDALMQTNVVVRSRDVCNRNDANFPPVTFCTNEKAENLDTCVGENGSGLICNGQLRGVVSKTCYDGVTQYTDVSQLYYWILISHLSETLKLIDNDSVKSIILGIADLFAYYADQPKLADDLEILKLLF